MPLGAQVGDQVRSHDPAPAGDQDGFGPDRGVILQIRGQGPLPVGEHTFQFSPDDSIAKPVPKRWKRQSVLNMIFKAAALLRWCEGMGVLPEGKGAGALSVDETGIVLMGDMFRDPGDAQGQDRELDAHFHPGPGPDASFLPYNLRRIPGRAQALQGSGPGVPAEDLARGGLERGSSGKRPDTWGCCPVQAGHGTKIADNLKNFRLRNFVTKGGDNAQSEPYQAGQRPD